MRQMSCFPFTDMSYSWAQKGRKELVPTVSFQGGGAAFKDSQAKLFPANPTWLHCANCGRAFGRSGSGRHSDGQLWDFLRNKMLIIRDVIYAQCSKDSPFSSSEKPYCLHNGAVNGAGTGCRKTALRHGLGNCDHSKNIISVTTGPRLNFASLRARVSHRNQHLHCSFPLNHFDTVTISQFYLRTV